MPDWFLPGTFLFSTIGQLCVALIILGAYRLLLKEGGFLSFALFILVWGYPPVGITFFLIVLIVKTIKKSRT